MFSAATKSAHGPATDVNYIESVFSTYLYTGNGSTQTINNGIDLSGKGGLVWLKKRGAGTGNHCLDDTVRGNLSVLHTNTTGAAQIGSGYNDFGDFTSTGFTMDYTAGNTNVSGSTYASWTFRKQPKFFDVVTYTGDGTSNKTIAHNLGSIPGFIIIKCTNNAGTVWATWHRGSDALFATGGVTGLELQSTAAGYTIYNYGSSVSNMAAAPTSSNIYVKNPSYDAAATNASGYTYVAYLFAHDAGGFGTSGTDNVISCGSFTTDVNGSATVSLGYEPQYVIIKRTDSTSGWIIFDVMRGMSLTNSLTLQANTSGQEIDNAADVLNPTATGFFVPNAQLPASSNWIYMAIRRPMKVPTSGTTVFIPQTRTGTGAIATVTGAGFTPDMGLSILRVPISFGTAPNIIDRLRGPTYWLPTNGTASEAAGPALLTSFDMNGYTVGVGDTNAGWNLSTNAYANYLFARRPGFFDEVCYTGTGGSGQNVNHNLTVAPELIIIKRRDGVIQWDVWQASLGNGYTMPLNYTNASSLTGYINYNSPYSTTTTFNVSFNSTNLIGGTYVAYLFATCPGVSKVGSYTGNGSTQAIACGFTGGARFVLIKKTSATGDWYVYDTARGMTTLIDPYYQLNTASGETATLGSVTTTTGGFTVNASILAAINTNGASYIFLAIA